MSGETLGSLALALLLLIAGANLFGQLAAMLLAMTVLPLVLRRLAPAGTSSPRTHRLSGS